MVVDDLTDLNALFTYIHDRKTLIVPVLADPNLHVSQNNVSCIYVYTEDGVERIVPIRHTEQLISFSEHLSRFLELSSVFVYDKKQWLQLGGNNTVWDIKTLWWYTYGEAYDETHYYTTAHTFYWRRHQTLNNVNALVPLMQHLAMCQKIRKYAWPMCINSKLTKSYLQFNELYPETFAAIERNGLHVTSEFKLPELIHSNTRVYSNYHYHTTTGRPSNAYRGFNFAAMNKEDGTRDAFCSRHERGALVEMDFDAYHVRLIARLINYELPAGSVHAYFGRFYFDTNTLTEEQYEQSKQITFRLLYGGIDSEFLSIPFFKQVNDFIYDLWRQWKANGFIKTPILHRTISSDTIKNMTANKLFNYYLQSVETEVSVQKLQQVQQILNDTETCMILYTYDSILFDVPLTEAREILPKIKTILESGNFPVKVKVGDIYSKMNIISL
jgi:hypothetical protein